MSEFFSTLLGGLLAIAGGVGTEVARSQLGLGEARLKKRRADLERFATAVTQAQLELVQFGFLKEEKDILIPFNKGMESSMLSALYFPHLLEKTYDYHTKRGDVMTAMAGFIGKGAPIMGMFHLAKKRDESLQGLWNEMTKAAQNLTNAVVEESKRLAAEEERATRPFWNPPY